MNMAKQQFILAMKITFIFFMFWIVAVSSVYFDGGYEGLSPHCYAWRTFLTFVYINGIVIFITVVFNVIYALVFKKEPNNKE